MSISVVIPTHNRARLLPRALNSVLSQTLTPDEIIVVDDGSTDVTRRILSERYPGVTVVSQSNRGVSAARNQGIRTAGSDWIAFLDSDDRWLCDKLQVQMAALECHPHLMICHCDEVWMRDGVRVNPMKKHRKKGGWIYGDCLPLCAISPSTVVVRRQVLLDEGGFNEQFPACEDYDLWLRLCAQYPVLFVERRLAIRYGGHADQLSKRYWGMDRFRVAALENMLNRRRLSPDQYLATLETLVAKLTVLVGGARKRRNLSVIDDFGARLEIHARHLAELKTKPDIGGDIPATSAVPTISGTAKC